MLFALVNPTVVIDAVTIRRKILRHAIAVRKMRLSWFADVQLRNKTSDKV